MGAAPLYFFFDEMIYYFNPLNAGVCWYPLKNNTDRLARVLMSSVSFFCVPAGLPGMKVCRVDSESARKTVFFSSLPTKCWLLWPPAAAGLQLCSLSTVSHQVLTQRMETCLDA